LKANVNFPGLAIRYTTDGGEPNEHSARYAGPLAVKGEVKLRSFDASGRGSRTTTPQVKGK
jgi:hexosaminidase